MLDNTHDDFRDRLPDLLHGTLDPTSHAAMEKHLAGCADCREEAAALRTIRGAPSFIPSIDATRIAALIPPYASGAALAYGKRAPQRRVLVATIATALAAVLVVLARVNGIHAPTAAQLARTADSVRSQASATAAGNTARVATERTARQSGPAQLQVAANLEGVSDDGVARLLEEIGTLPATPSADPEPFGVDESPGDSAALGGA